MELVEYTDADQWLVEALETDAGVMAELGGPWPRDAIPSIHRRRLEHVAKGSWYFKIVPAPEAPPVGAITLWTSDWNGEPISEAGWMVLSAHEVDVDYGGRILRCNHWVLPGAPERPGSAGDDRPVEREVRG